MDNFNTKPKKHSTKQRSLDGITRNRQPFVPKKEARPETVNLHRPISYRPTNTPVDDFRRPSGFHPTLQTRLGTENATLPQVPPDSSPPTFKRKAKGFKRLGRISFKSGLVLVMFVLLVVGFLSLKGYIKAKQIFKGGGDSALALQKDIDPSKLKGEGDGRVNIMILGKGGEGNTAPDLTDTILIASIDPIAKDAGLLSVPRDLYVKVSGAGMVKINSTYALAKNKVLAQGKITSSLKEQAEQAGLDAMEKMLEQTMGIPIHYYVMVDFEGFKQAVDTVGGVDVTAPSSVYESMFLQGKQYSLNVKPGPQHMDGFRALAYARSRYTSPRGDFDRSERQRLISVALKDKVLSLGTFANPIKLNELINNFGNHVQSNLSTDEVLKLYGLAKEIPSSSISSLGLADPPNNYVRTDFLNGQSVVVPRAGLVSYSEIQSYVRNTLKDGFIKKENPSIVVLNGTASAGKATAKAEELKSYGYNVISVADAPTKNYSKTVLVDMRSGEKKYTRHYLQLRFKTDAVNRLPDLNIQTSNADFVIILGSD